MFKGLFGGGKPTTPGQAALQNMTEAEDSSSKSDAAAKDKGSKGKGYSGGGFDPTGLERAAKAAKVLDSSPNAKQVLDLINAQNAAKAEEHKAQAAEYEAYRKQQEVLKVAAEAEEARKVKHTKEENINQSLSYVSVHGRCVYTDLSFSCLLQILCCVDARCTDRAREAESSVC
jgi:Domain of unknown function (DUF3523)